jgi:hypothetical protein
MVTRCVFPASTNSFASHLLSGTERSPVIEETQTRKNVGVINSNLVKLNTDLGIGTHPLDFMTNCRKNIKVISFESKIDREHAVSSLPIEMLDVTQQRSFGAAEVKFKHKLYYADSFAAALAIEHKATLVSSDSDFRKLGRGFPVVWLKS